jgi:glutathione S-transferase
VARVQQRLGFVAKHLEGSPYLMGDRFSAPDSYLYTVLSWAPNLKIDLSAFPSLEAFVKRVKERPTVRAAREAEGLPA